MNKILAFLLALFPVLLFAEDTSINFNPPPSDYSVVFLGNVFGVVEGVLHGTGSQILGNMFAVFNSAVMALGSIVIMYTLIVGTMNTAHEGQFLGQKWASIWVPMRSVAGMGLLIPQSSGYCIMQIFVMWVVVQGVGAADKVWDVALNYLNRGGVLVQAQMAPSVSLTADNSSIAKGAAAILQGQVCMLSMQLILEGARKKVVEAESKYKSGFCHDPIKEEFKVFCTKPLPDFISTINVVSYQEAKDKPSSNAGVAPAGTPAPKFTPPSSYELDMPYLPEETGYHSLNGICGTIKWKNFASTYSNFKNLSKYGENTGGTNSNATIQLSSGDLKTAELSRAIAIQQMYVDLSTIASAIVANNPFLSPRSNSNNPNAEAPAVPNVAILQFGVPQTAQGTLCTGGADCVGWGRDPNLTSHTAPLFNGTEFQGAISDYNAIMLPTLRLLKEAENAVSQQGARDFILKAQQSGWIMAGSYFFDLARLNAMGSSESTQTDKGTGLEDSISPVTKLASIFVQSLSCTNPDPIECACESSSYKNVCFWLYNHKDYVSKIKQALNGEGIVSIPIEDNMDKPDSKPITGAGSSTIWGFIDNSMLVRLPGQPGMHPPEFAMKFNMTVKPGPLSLPSISFPCGWVFWVGCIGRALADLFYNLLLRNIFDIFLGLIQNVVNNLFMTIVSIPLIGLSQIFLQGVSIIQHPSVNPIIALANMGVTYINFSAELWITLTMLAVAGTMIPVFGLAVLPILMCMFPLIAAWLGMMVLIGFMTAYYVPFLPYMIFTFASIGWLMAVIEAMVAAPIVALGVCFPEGHEAFGKSEAAFMILLNVFLRPTMMIIGFIAGIIMSYVSVWIINAGFANAIQFIQGNPSGPTYTYTSSDGKQYTGAAAAGMGVAGPVQEWGQHVGAAADKLHDDGKDMFNKDNTDTGGSYDVHSKPESTAAEAGAMNLQTGYPGWAGVFGFFMAILLYTMMYITVVQESFNLITSLPDKVLRWIGGQAETVGSETGKWTEQTKGQLDKAGEKTSSTMQGIGDRLQGSVASKASSMGKKSGGGAGDVDASKTPEIPG